MFVSFVRIVFCVIITIIIIIIIIIIYCLKYHSRKSPSLCHGVEGEAEAALKYVCVYLYT